MRYFYSDLISIETLYAKLDELDMTADQRVHLANLIDSTIHQEILNIIFDKLSEEDKLLFIERFRENPEDKEILNVLKSKSKDIEKEIKETVKKVSEELHEDMVDAKKGGKYD
jgi:DNA-directed RNA polymerase specialized sigma subunit